MSPRGDASYPAPLREVDRDQHGGGVKGIGIDMRPSILGCVLAGVLTLGASSTGTAQRAKFYPADEAVRAFARSPIDYRAIFARQNGQRSIRALVAGD